MVWYGDPYGIGWGRWAAPSRSPRLGPWSEGPHAVTGGQGGENLVRVSPRLWDAKVRAWLWRSLWWKQQQKGITRRPSVTMSSVPLTVLLWFVGQASSVMSLRHRSTAPDRRVECTPTW